jgi:hypothetical protein
MAMISQALQGLDEEAAGRVVRWATDRFGAKAPAASMPQESPAKRGFDDIASLYDAASPSSDAEKVLVVAYWMQIIGDELDLDAQRLNTELKQLGHGVSNITTAFRSLMQRTPRLALQIRKSGSTKQARKRYRLTTEGIRRVDEMVTRRNFGKE